MVRSRAFAPSHLTAFFAPDVRSRDPRGRGSIGAGIVLDVGVHAEAEWREDARRSVSVTADVPGPLPISEEVAERLFAGRPGALRVRLRHELPVGQGFGTSASGATAVALAVARLFDIPPSRAVTTAHLADLFGGGGLGGVAAILGPGVEVRRRAGVPPFGRVVHRPVTLPVFISVLGPPVPSPTLLRDPAMMRRVSSAAEGERASLSRRPDPIAILEAAERFGDALEIAPRGVVRAVRALRAPGIRVAATLFGRALYAVPATRRARTALVARLERLRVPAIEVSAGGTGAFAWPELELGSGS